MADRIVQAAFNWRIDQQACANVLHMKTDDTDYSALGGVTGIASLLSTAFAAKYTGCLNPLDAYLGCTVKDVRLPGDTTPPQEAVSVTGAAVGSVAGTKNVPPEVGTLVHFRTGFAVRGARGWFSPPPPQQTAFLDTGGIIKNPSGYWTGLSALVAQLANAAIGGSIWGAVANTGLVVYSRKHTLDTGAFVYYPVTAIQATTNVYTLRSRRPF